MFLFYGLYVFILWSACFYFMVCMFSFYGLYDLFYGQQIETHTPPNSEDKCVKK